jgi:hypothetical protein
MGVATSSTDFSGQEEDLDQDQDKDQHDLGESSASTADVARRAGHQRPDKLEPLHVEKCREFRVHAAQETLQERSASVYLRTFVLSL